MGQIDKVANDMQANILREALALFAAHGYEGVSVRQIAAAAGVTLPLIYHYFPDKQAVYDAAVQSAFGYMTEHMVKATQTGLTGKPRLRAFLSAIVELQTSGAPEVRLVDRELMELRPETMAKLGIEVFQKPHDALVEMLRELVPNAPVEEIAEHVIAAVYGAVKLRAVRAHLRGVERLSETKGIADSLYNFTIDALREKNGAK
jgi:TetR/AcrR family transcriptional regulator